MKLEQMTQKAIITSGWSRLVKRYKIEENDICMFSFLEEGGGLKINMTPLSCMV